MRALRPLFVPLLLGLVLLAIAFTTRTGKFGWDDPGQPINSAMRQALGQMILPPEDGELIAIRYPDLTVTESGLRYRVEEPSDSSLRPHRGEWVTIHFRETVLKDGTVVEDTREGDRGPLHVQVGLNRVPAGWDEALLSMAEGEKRTLIVPYWLGYGEKGQRGRVPARATTVVELELLKVTPADASATPKSS